MDKLSLKLTLNYLTLILGTVATASAALAYAWYKSWGASLDDILKILGLGIGATTAIYAAMNLRSIYDAHRETVDLKKKEFSANLIQHWIAPEMAALTIISHALKKNIADLEPKEVAELLESDATKKRAVISVLNFFEKVAISIKHGLSDEDILREFFRCIVQTNYSVLKGFIELKRQQSNNQRVFAEFESMAKRWY